jgi:DNA mismatch endonuclease, patch repair protein
MSGIRGKNTRPEILLRSALHARGLRFRLHVRMPGRPDLVFPRHRAVLFAHGCFWHGHECHLFRWPKTREQFWRDKIGRNRQVDERAQAALSESGWRCGVVWECALKGRLRLPLDEVADLCKAWLTSAEPRVEIRGRLWGVNASRPSRPTLRGRRG